MKPDDFVVAQHRPTWGHCLACNNWSYFLDTHKQICPKCNEKLEAETLQNIKPKNVF